MRLHEEDPDAHALLFGVANSHVSGKQTNQEFAPWLPLGLQRNLAKAGVTLCARLRVP